jgi:citrate/tricarballylate utilization protein
VIDDNLLAEANRQFTICNACRYCEGICAVFPALERRTGFDVTDMAYLANLCHDCRSCIDVCPYAPPHELAIDIPNLMSGIREKSYAHYAWPRALASRVDRSLRASLAFSTAIVLAIVALTVLGNGVERMLEANGGPGSFYAVIPYVAMFVPSMGISIAAFAIMGLAAIRFWRETGRGSDIGIRDVFHGTVDAALLRNLEGGGPGCAYPDDQPNHRRRGWHSLVFYGFIAAFISTALAFVYQDILGLLPPYDFLSLPVIFGSVGGVAMIVGAAGFLYDKARADRRQIAAPMRNMDFALLVSVLLMNITGMALLLLRESSAMPALLAVHLGYCAAFALTLPYGKFAHAVYRYLALIRNRLELARERRAGEVRTG